MTATATRPRPRPRPSGRTATRVRFADVVAAEWIKFRSVRSTVWALVATVVAMVGVGSLAAWGSASMGGGAPVSGPGLLSNGSMVGQLVVAVLGVLTITGEYSTGMVRSTFAAVPRRVPALAAKAIVLTAVVLVASVVAMVLTYVATMPFHSQLGATFDLSDGETVRMLVGLPLYLAAVALLAFAVGALLRHTAAALATILGLLLVVENVFALIPVRAFEAVSPFLPSTAGSRLLYDAETLAMVDEAMGGDVSLGPWQGYAVLLAWVAVLLGAALVLVRRRDA